MLMTPRPSQDVSTSSLTMMVLISERRSRESVILSQARDSTCQRLMPLENKSKEWLILSRTRETSSIEPDSNSDNN
jgi:hypothetical protein